MLELRAKEKFLRAELMGVIWKLVWAKWVHCHWSLETELSVQWFWLNRLPAVLFNCVSIFISVMHILWWPLKNQISQFHIILQLLGYQFKALFYKYMVLLNSSVHKTTQDVNISFTSCAFLCVIINDDYSGDDFAFLSGRREAWNHCLTLIKVVTVRRT